MEELFHPHCGCKKLLVNWERKALKWRNIGEGAWGNHSVVSTSFTVGENVGFIMLVLSLILLQYHDGEKDRCGFLFFCFLKTIQTLELGLGEWGSPAVACLNLTAHA